MLKKKQTKQSKGLPLLIGSIFIVILFLGAVSAFEFDNVKNYDEETQTIDIRNSILGIPFLQLGKIAEVQLNTPTNNYVVRGQDRLVAEFTIKNFKDYTEGTFDDLDFYNTNKDMEQFEREFVYKYKEFYGVEVIDYERVCKEREVTAFNKTGTYIEKYDCFQNQIGSHTEQRFNWVVLDEKADLQKGKIIIGIFTDVLPNEKVEWIPTLFGVKINEWATWTEALNVDLVLYYKLDDNLANTNVLDSLGTINGTLTGGDNTADLSVAGKIGTSLNLDGTNDYITYGTGVSESEFTIALWVNADVLEDGVDKDMLVWENAQGRGFSLANIGYLTYYGTNFRQSDVAIGTGNWNLVALSMNATGGYFYINGTAHGFNSDTGFVHGATEHAIGRRTDTGWSFDGKIDEYAVWGRALTPAEHSQLWNDGSGITYGEAGDTQPPYFTDGTPQNQTIPYLTAFNYTINATDETEFGCFAIDDTTNFQINCSGWLKNNTILGAALYNLNVSINDSLNNQNSTLFWVNVTKIDPSPSMDISGTTPIEYMTTSDFSESETNTGDGGCVYSLAPSNAVFGVGTWVFNYSTAGCDNYTAGSITKDLVVNKNDSLGVGLTATTPIEYPTVTNFAGSGCPGQLSCSLNISNIVYQAGTVYANYSTVGNDNYSATSADFAVVINQNSSFVLSISGTTPIVYGTITDVAGNDCPTQLSDCALDKANAVYGVGVSPITFNYSTAGNTNFTAGSITKDIIINQVTPAGSLDGTSPIDYGDAGDVEGTESNTGDDDLAYKLLREGIIVSNPDNDVLGAGVWNYIYNVTGGQNYTSVASLDTFALTINKISPAGNMAIAGTTPIEYMTTSDFSESETNTGDDGCAYSMDLSNGVYGVGTWVFNYSTAGCDNYTAGSVTKDLVVNKNDSLGLGLTGTTPVEYPATTDFIGSGCPGQLSCSLNISNAIYQAGDISANYSTTGNDNYSATSTDFTITINQNSSYVLGISGTTPIIYGTMTDVAGSGCPAQLSDCTLDKANAVYGVGASPVTFNYSTAGNTNFTAGSITRDITINIAGDTFTTLLNGVANNLTVTFPQQSNVSATNNLTTATIDVNGTSFTSGNNYTLGGGIWFVNVSTTGNENYSANESHWYITVNKAGDTFTTLLNGVANNLTVTFPQQVNVSVSDYDSAVTIDVNGTSFTPGNNYTLGSGVWFVNVSLSGNQNYTSNESHWYITMNQATPTGTIAGTSPIIYGALGDVTGSETNLYDADLVYRLLRDETIVANPDATTLGGGVYNYIYNVTGGQNYTSVASLDTFILTVNLDTGAGTLLLNGSATNYTINRTANVNITATLDAGIGDISVYIDAALFQTGSSPISDENQFNVLGWYLINFTYPGNENFTGFENYLYVNVTANPLAIVNIVYPTTGIDYESHFTELNYTVSNAANCWYNLGYGGGYIVITCGDNVTGITSVEGSNTWIIKAENLDGINTTDSVYFRVDLPIEYSTFTLRMVDVLKICIMIVGLFIIVMAGKSFFQGEMTFGRLFTIGVLVALGVGGVILLAPILINYISNLIK